MGIRLRDITTLAAGGISSSYKVLLSAGSATTRLLQLDTLADWILQTYAGFTQSGNGAIAESVSDALKRLPHSAQYGTTAQFNTVRATLDGTQAISPQVQFANFDNTATTPGALLYGGATFNGTYDPVLYLGYNISGQSANTRVNTSEPSAKFGLEGNYNDGSIVHMEWNLDYTSSDGLTTKRPMGWEINRATHASTWAWAGTTHTFYESTVGTAPSFQISLANWTSSPVIVIRAAGGSNELFQFGPTTAGAFTSFSFGFGSASGSGGWLDTTSTQANLYVGVTKVISATATGGAITGTLSTSGLYTANGNVAVAGSATPSVYLQPSSGATKNTQIYQSANTLIIADQGVANRFQMDIATGNIALNGQGPSASTGLLTSAGTTGVSSLRIPHGSAPTSPVNGDMWTDTSGAYIRINGVTKTFTLT